MRITLANPRGFCSGVQRAIRILSELLDRGSSSTLYVYHEIVHNRHVVDSFRQRGVQFIDSLDSIPEGSTLLFSAHGVSPAIVQQAQARHLICIDATCPRVSKIHDDVRYYTSKEYHILLIGHQGHDEIVGTLDQAPGQMTLVSSLADVDRIDFPIDQKLTCLIQTTFHAADAHAIIEKIRERFPQLEVPKHSGLCMATRSRQNALRRIDFPCDLVLVIGSEGSSNTKRLAEISRELGYITRMIDGPDDIDFQWFDHCQEIFITAGASAPEQIVQDCVDRLVEHFHAEVRQQDTLKESIQ